MRTINEPNFIGILFVFTELDLAETLLSLARTTRDPDRAKRNQQNARKAYSFVANLLPKLNLTTAQTLTIEKQMAALRLKFESLGETF